MNVICFYHTLTYSTLNKKGLGKKRSWKGRRERQAGEKQAETFWGIAENRRMATRSDKKQKLSTTGCELVQNRI